MQQGRLLLRTGHGGSLQPSAVADSIALSSPAVEAAPAAPVVDLSRTGPLQLTFERVDGNGARQPDIPCDGTRLDARTYTKTTCPNSHTCVVQHCMYCIN